MIVKAVTFTAVSFSNFCTLLFFRAFLFVFITINFNGLILIELILIGRVEQTALPFSSLCIGIHCECLTYFLLPAVYPSRTPFTVIDEVRTENRSFKPFKTSFISLVSPNTPITFSLYSTVSRLSVERSANVVGCFAALSFRGAFR